MINIKEKKNCCGCSACYSICPKNCISMEEDNEGFRYPKIDEEKCIKCGLCLRICPILSKKKTEENQIKTYAAINKNEETRLKSSSGGLFTAFAEYVLEQGGVVFGAGFNENFVVCHQACQTIEDLEKLRKSKYVQSVIGNTFKQAKDLLDQNRLVYFSGTPCQIAGLKSYLKKDYPNLIAQDLICLGVPSPLVWKKYLEMKTNEAKLKPASVCFRDKATGWKTYSFTIKFKKENNQEEVYTKSRYNEPYMNMFLYGKILRPSCYSCSFKGTNRVSDITLADFWGDKLKKIAPEMSDKKGCSLVIVHSKKGEEAFRQISDKIKFVEALPKDALKANPMVRKTAYKSPRRNSAMKNLSRLPFKKFVKKYGKVLI